MGLYTSNQADILLQFYNDKMVGKNIEPSLDCKIKYLKKELFEKDKYRVLAYGGETLISDITKRDIDLVAKDLNLELPADILKMSNPNQ